MEENFVETIQEYEEKNKDLKDLLDIKEWLSLNAKLSQKKNKARQELTKMGVLEKKGKNTYDNYKYFTEAQYKDFELPDGGVITIVDMPGYGRSMDEDETYKQIYLQELPKCDIILLVVQADTRDLTDDQIMIENLYEWSKEGRI